MILLDKGICTCKIYWRHPCAFVKLGQRNIGRPTNIYSNKKDTSDFHGTVSFDPVKM